MTLESPGTPRSQINGGLGGVVDRQTDRRSAGSVLLELGQEFAPFLNTPRKSLLTAFHSRKGPRRPKSGVTMAKRRRLDLGGDPATFLLKRPFFETWGLSPMGKRPAIVGNEEIASSPASPTGVRRRRGHFSGVLMYTPEELGS